MTGKVLAKATLWFGAHTVEAKWVERDEAVYLTVDGVLQSSEPVRDAEACLARELAEAHQDGLTAIRKRDALARELTEARLVLDEMERQDRKWGDQRRHPGEYWATILGEEYGELCKAVLEEGNVVEEAIHVAAVALQIVRSVKAQQEATAE